MVTSLNDLRLPSMMLFSPFSPTISLSLFSGCVCPSAPVAFSVMTGNAARSALHCVRPALVAVATSAPHAGPASTSMRAPTRASPPAPTASTSTKVRFLSGQTASTMHKLLTINNLFTKSWVFYIVPWS